MKLESIWLRNYSLIFNKAHDILSNQQYFHYLWLSVILTSCFFSAKCCSLKASLINSNSALFYVFDFLLFDFY